MTHHAAGFEQESFVRHTNWYAGEEAVIESNYQQRISGWSETVDGWRHERMVAICKPLIADGKQWITVGDGAYGCDAMLLERLGATAIATDISPTLLEYAHAKGGLREYKVANVEALPFEDQSCDYVLCKESWHHFPRPYLGIYEMLRVARRGIVLVEPTDPLFSMPALMWLVNVLDRIHPQLVQRIWKNRFSFERVGNYVYKLSVREMEKVAMGLALPAVAYLGLNDYYHPQRAAMPLKGSSGSLITRTIIGLKDALTWLGVIPPQQLAIVIFKQAPSSQERSELQTLGAVIRDLPPNPYTL